MKRREFITLLGGAAVAWPLPARPQQSERARRIGVLMTISENAPDGRARLGAFTQRLTELGWTDGRSAHLEIRWGAGDAERYRRYARELVALAPDVILADGSSSLAVLQQATRTVPIVFAGVIDPVGAGLIKSLARPGGNATGFTAFEYAIAAKWLEVLKEIAPSMTRAAVLRDSAIAAGIGQFAAIQAVAPIGMELSAIDLNNADAFEPAVAEFARGSNGGLVVTGSPFGATHPDMIVALAARYKLPAVYPLRRYVDDRRPRCLWVGFRKSVPTRSRLRRPYPQGREAGRPASAGADEVRASDQPQDRQDARPHSAGDGARPRRRGDRLM
jgi:putative ABC transport system substrate-binding protein